MKTCNGCDYFFWICERGEIDILRCKCKENGKRFKLETKEIQIVCGGKENMLVKPEIPTPSWCPKEVSA